MYDTLLGEYVDRVWDTMAIDLLPYVFTIDKLNFKEFNCFLIFYSQYANDACIDTSVINKYLQSIVNNTSKQNALDVFVSVIQTDITSLVSVLILMQYFFL